MRDTGLLGALLDLRLAIEPLGAPLAAARASEADLTELRGAYEAMAGAGRRTGYIEADLRFHGAVVRACGNVFIQQLETALSAVWKTSFQASSSPTGAPDSAALKLHQKLLVAIERHDAAGAEKAVHGLIARATTRIEGRSTP